MNNGTVLVLVNNELVGDARIEKQVLHLIDLGYRVKAIGISNNPRLTSWRGIEIHLVSPLLFIRTAWQKIKNKKSVAQSFDSSPSVTQATPQKRPSLSQRFRQILRKTISNIGNLLSAIFFIREIKTIDADFFYGVKLIHAHEIITLRAGYCLSKKYKIPLVYDSHEYETGVPHLSPVAKIGYHIIQKLCLRKQTEVITVSKQLAEQLERDYPGISTKIIHNSPIINPLPRGMKVRADLNLSDDIPLIVYVGNISKIRGLDEICGAMKLLPDHHFVHVNARIPAVDEQILAAARMNGVENRVHLANKQPHDKVVSYIDGCNVGLITTHMVCRNSEFALPNKLFELLFAKVPVVYHGEMRAIKELMHHYGIGYELSEITPLAIATGIRAILENPEKYAISTEIQQALIDKYGHEAQGRTLSQVYKQLIG